MDGPIKTAAERLLRDLSAALVAQKHHPQLREPLLEYVGELRALTLARHASYWVFLIQAFAVPDAMDAEMEGYLNAFAPQVDYPMADIIAGRFRQTASGDELIPWGGALNLLGQFWFPARERGVSESDLMSAMWASPHDWERARSAVVPVTECTAHADCGPVTRVGHSGHGHGPSEATGLWCWHFDEAWLGRPDEIPPEGSDLAARRAQQAEVNGGNPFAHKTYPTPK